MQGKQKKQQRSRSASFHPHLFPRIPLPWVSRQGIGMSLSCAPRLCCCSGWLKQRLQLGRLCPKVTLSYSLPEVTREEHVLPEAVKMPLPADCQVVLAKRRLLGDLNHYPVESLVCWEPWPHRALC
jgi:hypothetical protein